LARLPCPNALALAPNSVALGSGAVA